MPTISHPSSPDLVRSSVALEASNTMQRCSQFVFDGSDCCGSSDNFVVNGPVTFTDESTNDAEDMDADIGTDICADTGICDYFPSPGAGPGTNFSDFAGEDAAGDWLVCVGDGASIFGGTLDGGTLLVWTQ